MKPQLHPSSLPSHAISALVRQSEHPDDPCWLWLEDAQNERVSEFLNQANSASEQCFTPLKPLAETLYRSQLTRRELASESLRTPLDHHVYWSSIGAHDDYPVWFRHPIGHEEQVETLLDMQALSRQFTFVELGELAISPDERLLAWTLDSEGSEYYDLYIRELPAGKPQLLIKRIGEDVLWAEDNRTLLFTRMDDTQRPDRVCALNIVTQQETLLLNEPDPEFAVGFGKTRSHQWLVLECASKDTSESYLLPAQYPTAPPQCIRPRRPGVEYSIDHRPGVFYFLHNCSHRHFQIDIAAESTPNHWHPFIAPREHITLESVDAFRWGVVVSSRNHCDAQSHLRIIELKKLEEKSETAIRADADLPHVLTLHTPAHWLRDEDVVLNEMPMSLSLDDSVLFNETCLRLHEESFTTPPCWVSLDIRSGQRKVLKQQPVHGDLQPEQLISKRLWATANDGERVPVSVVMRADIAEQDQPLPTLLYGYGAYGEALDPWFSISRLELLARGVVFAVAHVRGGGERGEPWYLDGKLEHKENSFSDFLCARTALVNEGISDPERIAVYGASAGGLLLGTCLNRAPEAFCAAVLDVPFLDVLRTMQDPELPLTTSEYQEWGNPQDESTYQRIKDYSPLDNLASRPYPPMLIQGSWHDTRVPFWEPAKWFARINSMHCARGPVMLYTDMKSGHGGATGRFATWQEVARQDAFLLWALGVKS